MVKKVITKKVSVKQEEPAVKPDAEVKSLPAKRKGCPFCANKTSPTFTDLVSLKRYLTDRSRIVPRAKNYLCSKHQRKLTKHIKYARHLALLPFTPRV